MDGNTYTQSTTGPFVKIPNRIGCDSVISLHLDIITNDTMVQKTDTSLIASQANSTYRWLNCDSNYQRIAGEHSQEFKPIKNGRYALQITRGLCTDTTNCHAMYKVGINDIVSTPRINIYPNPLTDYLHIKSSAIEKNSSYELADLQGKVVLNGELVKYTTRLFIDQPAGVYFLTIKTDHAIYKKKLIKW